MSLLRGSRRALCTSSTLFRLRPPAFGQRAVRASIVKEAAAARCVVFGELHSTPPIVALQLEIMEQMAKAGVVHVVLEHFSFTMQPLLDEYMRGSLSFRGLVDSYNADGTEGHDLEPYASLLDHAQRHADRVRLHAGFIPRSFARTLMREGEQAALNAAVAAGYLDPSEVRAQSNVSLVGRWRAPIAAVATSHRGWTTSARPWSTLAHPRERTCTDSREYRCTLQLLRVAHQWT